MILLRFRRLRGPLVALAAVMALHGCGTRTTEPQSPVILVSVPPLGSLVGELTSPWAEIALLVPVGANPDVYEPTMDQLRLGNRVVLWVGIGHVGFPLEQNWGASLEEAYPRMEPYFLWDRADPAASDPHSWLSPRAVADAVPGLVAVLAARFPEKADEVRARGEAFLIRVNALDAELTAQLGPYRGRTFAVFHPAWGAFAEAYGLRQVALEEEGKEPSVEGMSRLVSELRALGIHTVFAQPQFSRHGIDVLGAELQAEVRILDPLNPAWEENLRATAQALIASWSDD